MLERIKWIDSIRGLAFLMIIYHHQYFMDSTLMEYFYPVFLSTFFVVSGFLWKRDLPYSEFLESRTRMFFIPFIIFSFLIVGSRYIFTFNEELEPFVPSMISMMLQDGKDDSIWFIPSLYIYSLFMYAIIKLVRNTEICMIIGIILAIINWVLIYRLDLPRLFYHIDQMGFGCYWLSVGYMMRKHYPTIKSMITGRRSNITLAIATITYCIMIYIWGDYSITFYGSQNLFIWFVVTLTGLYVMVGISNSRYLQNRLLCYIGANTLLAFIVHGKIHKLITALIISKVEIETLSDSVILAIGLAETIIVALLMLIPIYIINTYFPFLTGKGFRLWRSPARIINTDAR